MSEFHKGDKVVCVRAEPNEWDGSDMSLTLCREYTVIRITYGKLVIRNDRGEMAIMPDMRFVSAKKYYEQLGIVIPEIEVLF